jgi:hemolysin activation/secretion protein
VRGYPVAEASGDDGWIANLNVIHPLTRRGTIGAFFDAGGVTVNHAPAPGGFGPNRYTLASAGVSLDWRVTPHAVLNLTVAAPVGANLGGQPDGSNSDGSRRAARVWAGLNAAF